VVVFVLKDASQPSVRVDFELFAVKVSGAQ
jgi:hypothetical protein